MITIFDYGAGNLRSVENTLAEIGAPYRLVDSSEDLEAAEKIILPGVGHFGQLLRALDEKNVRAALAGRLRAGVPFLGICLGLQALFEDSEEAPDQRGLGLFPGRVRRFPEGLRVPHMGWNQLTALAPSRLLEGVAPGAHMYFAHSYYAPVVAETAASCEYGTAYTALLESANVCGVQFHPEKSGPVGLRIMRNFCQI